MAVYIVGYVHYYMERDRILHGKCGHTVFMHELLTYSVSEIEQVSTANKWDFWYKNNEFLNTVQRTFLMALCLLYTYWAFRIFTSHWTNEGRKVLCTACLLHFSFLNHVFKLQHLWKCKISFKSEILQTEWKWLC